jgi:hypothetical protein
MARRISADRASAIAEARQSLHELLDALIDAQEKSVPGTRHHQHGWPDVKKLVDEASAAVRLCGAKSRRVRKSDLPVNFSFKFMEEPAHRSAILAYAAMTLLAPFDGSFNAYAKCRSRALCGGDITDIPQAPGELEQRLLCDLLKKFTIGVLPANLYSDLAAAMHGLERGDIHPIFRPPRGTNPRRATAHRLRSKAVWHADKFQFCGFGREEALALVARAFGVTKSAIRTWETRDLPKIMSSEELAELTCSKHVGYQGSPEFIETFAVNLIRSVTAVGAEYRHRTKGRSFVR